MDKIFSLENLIQKVSRIVDGVEQIPILYDLWKTPDTSNVLEEIHEIRKEKDYVDLFHAPQIPFSELMSQLSTSFEFSDLQPDLGTIEAFFSEISDATRFIHVSLHYLINASRLIPNYFTEEAAINLNLASEAIIKDYMLVTNTNNKKAAIESLLSVHLHFTEEKIDWMIELYEARNAYLAHIDEDMFTDFQNIDDPDKYCYDHYEDICDLIIGYIRLRKSSGI